MGSVSNKAFVLGLDGGSWNLLRHFIDKGYMPNLRRICENGVSGTLLSTKPPYTGPAWVSSFTGVNPGKHGIFGFTTLREGMPQRSLISSRTIKAKKIWHYLDQAGKRSGFINVPVTYPVEKINEFMISGFLAPQEVKDFTYPVGLYEELINEIGTYIINVKISVLKLNTGDKANEFIDDVMFCTQKQLEAMKLLWSMYSPDLASE
jgi:predicted AlkP superfamily phosphohydrolase/phosphomutase